MSFILLGILNSQAAAGGAGKYFMANFISAGNEESGGLATDSSNNFIIVGRSDNIGAGGFDAYITKISPAGTILWQRTLGSGSDERFVRVAVDSADNIFAAGDSYLAKYDSSGVLQYQKTITGISIGDVAVDPSTDDVYLSGNLSGTGLFAAGIQKINNSTGAVVAQKKLDASQFDLGLSVTVDSASNPYLGGYSADSGVAHDALIAKFDSSLNNTFQFKLQGSGNYEQADRLVVDSSDSLIVSSFIGNLSDDDGLIIKIDSSGNVLFSNKFSDGATLTRLAQGLAVDSADNYYACGRTRNSEGLIVKYNSSGNVIWAREITVATGSMIIDDIEVDSDDNLIITGTSDAFGNNEIFFMRFPSDGSLTGTYTLGTTDITYAANSGSASTTTLTKISNPTSISTPSDSSSNSSLVDAAASLTTNQTDI